MSPESRRRKRAKSSRSGQQVVRRTRPTEVDQCHCPACSDADFDPQHFIGDLVAEGADLIKTDDPVEAELFAATFLSAGDLAGEGFAEALNEGLLPAVAEIGTPEALAVLIAIDAVREGTVAAAAAQRLVDAGVPTPSWASELRQPVQVGPCRRFADPAGSAAMLVCAFERAGRSYGFVVHVDHLDCDAAANIVLFPADALNEVVNTIQQNGLRAGVTIVEELLEPAEFRWQVERALDARADHDQERDPSEFDDEFEDEDGPGYHMLAVLLRAWIRTLPEPTRPPAPHDTHSRQPTLELLEMISQITGQAQQIQTRAGRRTAGRKLPAKRKKSGPAAPIYQLKVGLREAKPPIWRRLELPADISLADLHDIIQVAFGWDDSHLHVFETPYGDFGVADRELGYRAEAPVTLEQVAPAVGDRLRYTYDFGDNWAHDIVVEKVLPRQPIAYPRCTGGRRAAPPDDCGGIWGYAELVEVLSDPGHPEHGDRLDWLGLASAADFQPARFDATEITRALTEGSRG
ncbi:plasmid pRiA4b ORF-3 family protein [Micromonospora sp. D93]|uniref:plasmid pRiA4b ORF-3 family protein n=1 Tax=Micromonospora sp. D93 TaxID=2824886 RepID=UPI001B39BB9A|nr:plasmid pRiA4b ORF-3 family protein [Micromonospora sp. D93]MBQ1018169.1 plasmid pRiA4b ORF-3 family protein [Micromonospora sp. D93]